MRARFGALRQLPELVASPVGVAPSVDSVPAPGVAVPVGLGDGARLWYSSIALVSTGTLAETPSAPEYEK